MAAKLLTEFIGTFMLMFAIGMNVIDPGSGTLAPIAIGFTLMVMVYAGGHISGAHYNPAVTLAVWLRGRCKSSEVLPYMVSQCLGAAVACGVIKYLKAGATIAASNPAFLQGAIAELIVTFALCYVVLNVATSKDSPGNSFYGLAIGSTVTIGAYSVGSISGGAFNPAVALGVILLGLVAPSAIAMFLIANFAGGALAAVVFKFANPADK